MAAKQLVRAPTAAVREAATGVAPVGRSSAYRGNAAAQEQLAASGGVKKDWLTGAATVDKAGASAQASLLGLSDTTGTAGVLNVGGSIGTTKNAAGGTTSGASISGSAVNAQFDDGKAVTLLGGGVTAGKTTDGKGNSSTGLSVGGSVLNAQDASADVDVGNASLFAGVEQNADGSGFAGVKGEGGVMHAEMDNGAVVDIGQGHASMGATTNADGSKFEGASVDAAGLNVYGVGGAEMRIAGMDAHSGVETDAEGNERFVAQGEGSLFQLESGEAWEHVNASGKVLDVDVDAMADANQEKLGLNVTPLEVAASFDAKNKEHQSAGISFGDELGSLDVHESHGDTNADGLKEYGAGIDVDLFDTKFAVGKETRVADTNGDGVDEEVGKSVNLGFLDVNTGQMGDTDKDGMMETGANVSGKWLGMDVGLGYESKKGDTNGDGVEETGFGLDLGPAGIDVGDTNHDGKSDFSGHVGPVSTTISDTDGDGQQDYNLAASVAGLKANYSSEDPLGDLGEVLNPFDSGKHDDDHNTTQAVIDTAVAAKDAVVGGVTSAKDSVVGAAKGVGAFASNLWGRWTGK